MTTEAVRLDISLPSIDLSLFDVLEVHRSRSGIAGPYEHITANGTKGARVPSTIEEDPPWPPETGPALYLAGKSLGLRVNDAVDLLLSPTGVDPLTLAIVATEIQAQGSGLLRSFVVGARLVIETLEVGNQMSLEVTGGDVAGATGLPVGSVSYGRENYILLTPGTLRYSFVDRQGSNSYFYKTRFRNRLLDSVSDFSDAFSPTLISPVVSTIIGYVQLIAGNGKPLISREVHVYSRLDGNLIGGRVVAGFSERKLTDENGYVEFTLVRGLPIAVAVAGTDLVRDIELPSGSTPERLNLFDPSFGANDLFKVQVPNVPYATRRSL